MTNIVDSIYLPKGLKIIGKMLNGRVYRHVDLQNNIYIFVAGSMYKRVSKHSQRQEWMTDELCDGVIYRKIISTEYGEEYYKRVLIYE